MEFDKPAEVDTGELEDKVGGSLSELEGKFDKSAEVDLADTGALPDTVGEPLSEPEMEFDKPAEVVLADTEELPAKVGVSLLELEVEFDKPAKVGIADTGELPDTVDEIEQALSGLSSMRATGASIPPLFNCLLLFTVMLTVL